MTIKAILTKPLDGDAEGTERDFDKADFVRLEAMGAVRKVATDPVAAEDPAHEAEEKAAPAVANKMAPAVQNKAERPARRKTED